MAGGQVLIFGSGKGEGSEMEQLAGWLSEPPPLKYPAGFSGKS